MMRRILLVAVLLLAGCTKIEHQNVDYGQYVNMIFENNNNYVNKAAKGYKYYLPKGIIVKKRIDNNFVLKTDNTNLYLYIDTISYFYDKKIDLQDFKNYDYKKDLNDGKYLVVDENNGLYYIKLIGNYSTIEFYAPKKNIPRLLTLSSIILESIKFNKVIIKAELDDNKSFSNEKKYEIDDLERNTSNFSKYLNSFVEEKGEDNKLPD